MKIAIPIEDKTGPSFNINDKFGRCPFFYLFDDDKSEITILDNEKSTQSAHGSGIQTSSLLAQNNVNVVIIKQIGPKAQDILKKSNIKIYKSVDTNDVNKLVDMYKNNLLEELS